MPRQLAALLAGLLLLPCAAGAQDYPRRPARVPEPLAAGSAVARIMTDRMSRIILVLDNAGWHGPKGLAILSGSLP